MKTLNFSQSVRQRLEKTFKCDLHTTNNKSKVINIRAKKCSQKNIDSLIKKDVFTKRRNYICEDCLNHDFRNLEVNKEIEEIEDNVDTTSNGRPSQFDDSSSQETLTEFKNMIEKLISKDITSLYKEKLCSNPKSVLLYHINKWNESCSEELRNLLKVICKSDNTLHSNYLLANLIEQIYKCRNSRLVQPLSFQEASVTYKLSNRAQLSALNSKSKPSGLHTYITSWLNKLAANEIEFPPGVVQTVFDNEQVVGKRYHVKADQSTVPSSIIPSSIYLSIDKTNDIQNNENLRLVHLMFQPVDDILINKTINSFDEKNNTFRMARNNLLKERMDILAGDLKRRDDEELFDLINEIVKAKERATMFKFCPVCKEEAPFRNRACKLCKEKLIKLNDTFDINKTPLPVDLYNHFKNKATENNVKLIVGEPDMSNPNGYKNISTVMYNIGKCAKID